MVSLNYLVFLCFYLFYTHLYKHKHLIDLALICDKYIVVTIFSVINISNENQGVMELSFSKVCQWAI